MISPLLLERPGQWRLWSMIAVFVFLSVPALPLLWFSVSSLEFFTLGPAFWAGLRNSLFIALAVFLVSLMGGLPLGVLAGLYLVPLRKGLLALTALPLVVPTFLWAIGWSALSAQGGRSVAAALSGFAGCILVFSALGIPLVLLTCYAVTRRLTASQVEAARLFGGEQVVIWNALRAAVQPALMAAAVAAVLTLSDPGPGFIFGLQTAAAEILTSFSAFYDFELAGRQCLVLGAAVLLLAGPLAVLAAPRLASAVLPRLSHFGWAFPGTFPGDFSSTDRVTSPSLSSWDPIREGHCGGFTDRVEYGCLRRRRGASGNCCRFSPGFPCGSKCPPSYALSGPGGGFVLLTSSLAGTRSDPDGLFFTCLGGSTFAEPVDPGARPGHSLSAHCGCPGVAGLGQHFAHVESGCCHTWAAFEKISWADFPAVSGPKRGAGPSSGEEFVVGTFDNLHYGRVF